MTNSASAIHLDTQFDPFLFAAIGEGKDGMCVTVLSGLARLNVDPWQKAAELSRLTRTAAGQKLAALISTLPDFSNLESGLIDRLVDLLPTRVAAVKASGKTFGFRDLAHTKTIVILVALVAIVIAAQYVWANSRPRPAEDIGATISGAATSSPPTNSNH